MVANAAHAGLARAINPVSTMLDGDTIYAISTGAQRGGIDERWFSSTVRADNGPGTPDDEGLSYLYVGGEKVTLLDAMTIGFEKPEQIDDVLRLLEKYPART